MNEFKLPDCKHTPKPFPYGTAVMLEPRVPTCSFCESEAKDAEIARLTAEVRALRDVAEAVRDTRTQAAVVRLIDLSAAMVPTHASAIGLGAEFTIHVFVGDSDRATFDAEPFVQDCAALLVLLDNDDADEAALSTIDAKEPT